MPKTNVQSIIKLLLNNELLIYYKLSQPFTKRGSFFYCKTRKIFITKRAGLLFQNEPFLLQNEPIITKHGTTYDHYFAIFHCFPFKVSL